MKTGILVIILLLFFVNITSIGALESNNELDIGQIVEIDNDLSKNKARNTPNPRVIEVEQSNSIYLHYTQDCKISGIDDREREKRYASVEVYTNDDFKDNKNTLLIYPFTERDFIVKFNCTKLPLIIKSLSPSKFNETEPITSEEVTEIVEKTSNGSVRKITSFINESYDDSNEKLENITQWTRKQDEKGRINDCKEKWKFPIVIIESLIALGLIGNINQNYRRKFLKIIKKHRVIYSIIFILIIIFIWYFNFSKNPFFC